MMQEFKGMLYKSMEDPNVDLANVSTGACHLKRVLLLLVFMGLNSASNMKKYWSCPD